MTLYITYLEEVRGIKFDLDDTSAEFSLLNENIARIGLKIEPSLTAACSSAAGNIFKVCYHSTNISYLVKANSFSSIEAMKAGVLKGFTPHISTELGLSMEYKFENDSEEKLIVYFNTPRQASPEQQITTEDFSAALSANLTTFFNQANTAISVDQQSPPRERRSCTIL